MINILKDSIKKSKIYWKYRHLFEPHVWHIYQKDATSKRRDFYSKLVNSSQATSVFEFGCASGSNYASMTRNNVNVSYFGFDISKAAIREANSSAHDKGVEFHNKLRIELVRKFLATQEIVGFDIAIYDRVLYLLSDSEVQAHFKTYSQYFEKIVIDDFHSSDVPNSVSSYKVRNFEVEMSKFDFKLEYNEKSEHEGETDFFSKYARRLVFKRQSIHQGL